jgi:hypothetical protein
VIVVAVIGAALLAARALRPSHTAGPCVVVAGPVMLPDLPETSGLAVSRRAPGLLWSHNDSGNDAVLFALDTSGRMRGRVRVPIRAVDWEDISSGRCASGDCLYLADIGDNGRGRRRIQIFRLPEPLPGDAVTAAPDVFTATYSDGPHNAEAMFVADDDLFIVTRDRVAAVYHARLSGRRDLTFVRLSELGLAAVTDAETSTDGKLVIVRTSHEAVGYRIADVVAGGNTPLFRIPIDGLREPQGEGVALDGSTLFLSSEGWRWSPAGRFVSLRCQLPQ